ncbi:MAG TPA: 30S ribosomal protein S20 [Candidatus Limnocylindria bacterium]
MAKKKRSALKRIRQAPRRAAIKVLARSSARTAVKRARVAIAAGAADAADAVRDAASALDRAAKRKGIHPNAAARRKSRLAKAAKR